MSNSVPFKTMMPVIIGISVVIATTIILCKQQSQEQFTPTSKNTKNSSQQTSEEKNAPVETEKVELKKTSTEKATSQQVSAKNSDRAIRSKKEFDAIIAQGTSIIKFGAEWCGPCKKMIPIFEAVANEICCTTFATVDVDANIDIAQAYNVRGIPTFVCFHDGKEFKRVSGERTKKELKTIFESWIDEIKAK